MVVGAGESLGRHTAQAIGPARHRATRRAPFHFDLRACDYVDDLEGGLKGWQAPLEPYDRVGAVRLPPYFWPPRVHGGDYRRFSGGL